MFKSVFLDANIFIDANDKERKSFEESYKIVPFCLEEGIRVYTSCDLITTIYYILSKISKEQALLGIEQINKFCNIIEFSNKDVESTCKLMRENSKFSDLEDAMQYVLAKREGCEVIISNDRNFFSPELPLFSSEKFCKKYIDKE